jgi:serpin B
LVVAVLAAAILLPACGGAPASEPPVQAVSMTLTDSSTGFGLKLVDHLLAEKDAGNVFVSPLSATILLAMVASAAQGETRAAMLKALALDPTVDPGPEIGVTIARLAQSDANAQLELAQAVWIQNGLVLSPAYVRKLRESYRAQLANVDFTQPAAVDTINRWVDSATHHKIARIVDSLDPTTVGFLVNATYFHALWATEFKSARAGDFHRFDGTSSSLPMMRRTEDVTVLHTLDFDAALVPYKGNRYSALILLPQDRFGPAQFSAFLTSATWTSTLDLLRRATGPTFGDRCAAVEATGSTVSCDNTLVMPKFTLDYEKDLTTTLNALGYPVPASLPDFCGACFLSFVKQKSYLSVDEKGTTAAAVTGGAVATALRQPVVVDHPFALALLDNATGSPLFLGAIGDL